jgi:hypothetical protein
LYAHKHDCYTRFNTFQPLSFTFFRTPGIGNAKTRTSSLINFPYAHYAFACPLRSNDLLTFFHRLWPQHPTAFTVIRLQLKLDTHLPAYINNTMNKYKATMRLCSGRSFVIMHRRDCLPSTYKVLLFNVPLRIYACYSLLPYYNRTGNCLSLFATPTRT